MSLRSVGSAFRHKEVISSEARVVLMDNTCLEVKFDKEHCLTGVAILQRIGEQLAIPKSDLKYFGLKYPDTDGQMNWLTLSDAVKHSFKKRYQFQLGVRVYPDPCVDLSESCARLCCYQIKCDVNQGHLMCTPSEHVAIDSYFAQAVIGDFKPKIHTPGYLEDYLGSFFMHPSGINCSAEIRARDYESDVVKRHRDHCGMTPKESWLALLNVASSIPHFNALKHRAKDSSDKTTVLISVSQEGIKIYGLNKLNEPERLKRHYDWRSLSNIICYKNKLIVSTAAGKPKFKFSGLHGDKAAHRVLDDVLESRLFYNCSLTHTNPLTYHTEESKRSEAFARRSSKYQSFRNAPVEERTGSIRRMYSNIRSTFSGKRRKRTPTIGAVDNDELGYKSRLSRIEILPNM